MRRFLGCQFQVKTREAFNQLKSCFFALARKLSEAGQRCGNSVAVACRRDFTGELPIERAECEVAVSILQVAQEEQRTDPEKRSLYMRVGVLDVLTEFAMRDPEYARSRLKPPSED